MFKSLIALAIASVSVSAAAQAVQAPQNAPAANQTQPAKPQMVKKRVCEESDNPYSRISRVCHTVEIPAQTGTASNNQQAPAQAPEQNSGN
jgi:cytochrome c5